MAQQNLESYQSGEEAVGENEETTWSWLRLLAFKGLAILLSLFILVSFNVVFLMIVVSWLPDATYMAIIGDLETADLVHRVHDSIIPIIAWSMLIGTVVQLRRPYESVAPLLMVLAIPAMFTVVELATGTYVLWTTTLFLAVLLLIALLHPSFRELVN